MNATDESKIDKIQKADSNKTEKRFLLILFCMLTCVIVFHLFFGWILSHTCEIAQHNMNGATGNEVYLHPDGHSEAVFDSSGNRVTDAENMASYNYYHWQKQPWRHFYYDTLPWLIWGNSENDTTFILQRLRAWLTDVKYGAMDAFGILE
jgi:hypothetical protein